MMMNKRCLGVLANCLSWFKASPGYSWKLVLHKQFDELATLSR